jgi:predicted helicase
VTIQYHDIGDNLTRDDKLRIVREIGSIEHLPSIAITPNEEGDWINQRSADYGTFIAIGDKRPGGITIFSTYSLGLATGRDSWVYGFSSSDVAAKVSAMIRHYNEQVDRVEQGKSEIDLNPRRIS